MLTTLQKRGNHEDQNHNILGNFSLKTFSPEQDFTRKENQSSRIILERPRLQTSRRNYQPKLLAVKKQRNFIAVEETVIKINGEKRNPVRGGQFF